MALTPRPYQIEASEKAWSMASTGPALICLPTGTGKTFTELLVAQRARATSRKPVLWLAHRGELMEQAARAFRAHGWIAFLEKAGKRAKPAQVRMAALDDRFPAVVIASVPTMQGRRLKQWRPDDFAAVLVDEAHHGVASTWRRILTYFECPVIGFTATPQRKGLDSLFDVAYSMTLNQAISKGWLVPVQGRTITPEGWDMSKFRRPRGGADIDASELADMVEKHMPAALAPLLEHMAGRPTLSFWPSVIAAQGCAEWVGAVEIPACWVSGETPPDERTSAIEAFREGRILSLSNCAVLTEGFDAPSTRLLAIARPTRSEVMYVQMLGRALRPLPGVIDGLQTAEERRAAIADSAKPAATVLDYHGSGAQFDVMSLLTVLGSGQPPEVIARAEREMAGGVVDVDGALAKAADEIEEERRANQARAERVAEERAARNAEQAAQRNAERAAALDLQQHAYQVEDAPWLNAGVGARLEGRKAGEGEERATMPQRRALYAILKSAQGVDKRMASHVWRASATWSKSQASKEIVFLKCRYGASKRGRQGAKEMEPA